jgi:hypothetical protein
LQPSATAAIKVVIERSAAVRSDPSRVCITSHPFSS